MPQIVNKKSVLEMAMGAIAEITDYEVCLLYTSDAADEL